MESKLIQQNDYELINENQVQNLLSEQNLFQIKDLIVKQRVQNFQIQATKNSNPQKSSINNLYQAVEQQSKTNNLFQTNEQNSQQKPNQSLLVKNLKQVISNEIKNKQYKEKFQIVNGSVKTLNSMQSMKKIIIDKKSTQNFDETYIEHALVKNDQLFNDLKDQQFSQNFLSYKLYEEITIDDEEFDNIEEDENIIIKNDLILQLNNEEISCFKLISLKLIICGNKDGKITLYSKNALNLRQKEFELIGHSNKVTCLELIDQQTLASGCQDGKIKLWDLNQQICQKTLIYHFARINIIIIKNNYLISGSDDHQIIIYDLIDNQIYRTFNDHSDGVTCLLNYQDYQLISASGDKNIIIWNLQTEQNKQFTIRFAHSMKISCLVLNSQQDLLVSGSQDLVIKVWDMESKMKKFQLNGHSMEISSLFFINDKFLLSSSLKQDLKIWSIDKQFCIKTSQQQSPFTFFTNFNQQFFAANQDKIQQFNITIQEQQELKPEQIGDEIEFHFDETKKYFLFKSLQRQKNIIAIILYNQVITINYLNTSDEGISCLLISNDDLLTGHKDGTISIMNYNKLRQINLLEGHKSSVNCLLVKYDFLISGSKDGSIQLWLVKSQQSIQTIEQAHEKSITCLIDFQQMIISSSQDGKVKIWNLNNNQLQLSKVILEQNTLEIICLQSFDDTIVCGASDGSMIFIQNETKKIKEHNKKVNCLNVSQNILYSGSDDEYVLIWDLKILSVKNRISCMFGAIQQISISQNKFLLIASKQQVKVYETEYFHEIQDFYKTHDQFQIQYMANAQNDSVFTGSSKGELHVWKFKESIKKGSIDKDKPQQFIDVFSKNLADRLYKQIQCKYFPNCLLKQDNGNLIIGFTNGQMKIYSINDPDNPECVYDFSAHQLHKDSVNCLILSKRKMLFSASSDHTIKIWESQDSLTYNNWQTLKGHKGSVNNLNFTNQDYFKLISGGSDNQIFLWQRNLQTQIWSIEIRLQGHSDAVLCFAVNQKYLISGSRDTTIRIWKHLEGKEMDSLEGHKKAVNCLALSKDDQIISGSDDCQIRIWNLETRKLIKKLTGHVEGVNKIIFLNEQVLLSASKDKTIKFWNYRESNLSSQTMTKHKKQVNDLCISDNGYIISISDDKKINLWEIETNSCFKTLQEITNSIKCVIQADDLIIAGYHGKFIKIFNFDDKKLKGILIGHTSTVNCLAYTKKQVLISGGKDRKIIFWDLKSQQYDYIMSGHNASVNWLEINEYLQEQILISGSDDATIRIWDIEKKYQLHQLLGPQGKISQFLFITNSDLISVSKKGSFAHWKIDQQDLKNSNLFFQKQNAHIKAINCIAYSAYDPNNKYVTFPDLIATGGSDNTTKLWNLQTKEIVYSYKGHNRKIRSVLFTKDRILVTGSNDGKIKFWDIMKQIQIKNFDAHNQPLSRLIMHDSGALISSSYDRSIMEWDIESGSSFKFGQVENTIYSILLNKEEKIITSSQDKSIKFWNQEYSKCEKILENHQHSVKCMIFDENQTLISGSQDKSIIVWDQNQNSPKYTHVIHSLGVNAMISIPNCRIVTGSDDRKIVVWENYNCYDPQFYLLKGSQHSGSVLCLSYVPPNKQNNQIEKIVSGGSNNFIKVWALGRSKVSNFLYNLIGHQSGVLCIQYFEMQNQDFLASGSENGYLKIWDLKSQICITTLDDNDGLSINCLQLYKTKNIVNGYKCEILKYLITGSDNSMINIIDLERFKLTDSIIEYDQKIKSLLVKDDLIYCGYQDQVIKIYSFDAIKFKNSQEIMNFVFSPNMNLCQDKLVSIKLGYFELSVMHIICYLNDIDIFKNFLNYLQKNKIYLHQNKDYFGKTTFEIIGNNYLWMNEIIEYYNSFSNLDDNYCSCCSFAFKKLIDVALDNQVNNVSSLIEKRFLNCVKDTKTNVCGDFDEPIVISYDKNFISRDEYSKLVPIKKSSHKQVEYEVKYIQCTDIFKIQDKNELFLSRIQEYDVTHDIFMNPVIKHIINFKWNLYGFKIFVFQTVVFYAQVIAFILLCNVDKMFHDNNQEFQNVISYIVLIMALIVSLDQIIQSLQLGVFKFFSSIWNQQYFIINALLITDFFTIDQINQVDSKILRSFTFIVMLFQSFNYFRAISELAFIIRILQQVCQDIVWFLLILVQIVFGMSFALAITQQDSFNLKFPLLIFQEYIFCFLGWWESWQVNGIGFSENMERLNNYISFTFILITIGINIVMMNLLISLVGKTFSKVVDIKENARNLELTKIIFTIEKTMSPLTTYFFSQKIKPFCIIIDKKQIDEKIHIENQIQQLTDHIDDLNIRYSDEIKKINQRIAINHQESSSNQQQILNMLEKK